VPRAGVLVPVTMLAGIQHMLCEGNQWHSLGEVTSKNGITGQAFSYIHMPVRRYFLLSAFKGES